MKDFEKSRLPTSDSKSEDIEKLRITAYAQGLASGSADGKQEHCPYTGGLGARFWNEGFRAARSVLD